MKKIASYPNLPNKIIQEIIKKVQKNQKLYQYTHSFSQEEFIQLLEEIGPDSKLRAYMLSQAFKPEPSLHDKLQFLKVFYC